MSQRNYEAILKKCQNLTKDGATLSVAWNGGGDEGQFELKLNDKELETDYGHEDSIVDLVWAELDYGYFAGPFSTTGEVVYDSEKKCFEGTDTYSDTDSISTNCNITIHLPETLWFDRLELHFEQDFADPFYSATLIVLNGPVTDGHATMESQTAQEFAKQMRECISRIYNFDSMNEQFTFNRSDFMLEGDELVCVINEFSFWCNNITEKDIFISLTE